MSEKPRVIGYVRVSTKRQAEEGTSIHDQERKIQAYATLYDLELIGIEIDPGASGKSLRRPALARALQAMETGRADGIVIAKLDRLSRSIVDMGNLINQYFKKYTLYCVGEQINTSTASGELVANILMSVAQWERKTIVERTNAGLQCLKNQGVQLGREAYGWTHTEEVGEAGRRVIAPVDTELKTIQRVVELHKAGTTYRDICTILTKEGHSTKRGGAWSTSTVYAILRRERRRLWRQAA